MRYPPSSAALDQIEPRRHHEMELAVRHPQGPFHFMGRSATGEDETGVTRSLWERAEFFGRFGGNGDIFNAGHTEGRIEPIDTLEKASTRDREHHRPGSALFPGEGRK